MADEFNIAIFWESGAHMGVKSITHLSWVLIAYQTERDFCAGFRCNHRFGANAGIAADDAVHVTGRA